MKLVLNWIAIVGVLAFSEGVLRAAGLNDQVVVVYNRNLAESKSLAEYYAQRRQIPNDRLCGLDLPNSETMSRNEYDDRLAQPLLKKMRDNRWWVYSGSGKRHNKNATNEFPVEAKIRYATLCYGVPLKILNDPKLAEDGLDKVRPELKRNDAAVDSELALLPVIWFKPHLTAAIPNRAYGVTNTAGLSPTNGILVVGRLDGPTVELARGLVDKAIQAERDGLWGRAYFDSRGFTNSSYKLGDDWIRGASQVTRRLGFDTVLDQEMATWPVSFPMSHIAIYAGWYDANVSGPFTLPEVEFMPGAFAYHLHSFSAQTIRSTTANWVGPLIAKGATITMGCVEEPYLEGTPDVVTFVLRLLYFGFTFGEAASACQNAFSWQTTVVGDPLYRPIARPSLELHQDLLRRKSKLVEWSHLKVVNLNLTTGMPADKLIEYLETTSETRESSVLLEKLGDLYYLKAQWDEAAAKYREALQRGPSRQQKVRLYLTLAQARETTGQNEEAFRAYEELIQAVPDYPDLLGLYRKLVPLAEQLGKTKEQERYQQDIDRLTHPASPPKP